MFGLSKLHKRRNRMHANSVSLEKVASRARQRYINQTLQATTSPEGLLTGFALGFITNYNTDKEAHYQLIKSVKKTIFQLIQQSLLIKKAENE